MVEQKIENRTRIDEEAPLRRLCCITEAESRAPRVREKIPYDPTWFW